MKLQMSNWSKYFHNQFWEELREFSSTRIPEHHCEHCKAPQERRCLIDEKFLDQQQNFRFAWYGVTLYEQGLFTYFPEAHERWISHRGSYPLPVENIGMGCVRVVAPLRLLSPSDNESEWLDYVKFWLEYTEHTFEEMTSIAPSSFFGAIRSDRDLVAIPHGIDFQAKLLEEALKRFKID
jgi:hypothetical protein